MSSTRKKINDLLDRISQERRPHNPPMGTPRHHPATGGTPPSRPLQLGLNSNSNSPIMQRPQNLTFTTRKNDNFETERKLKEIMKISGDLKIDNVVYKTDIKDMEDLEVLGNGTCGHVVKMRHKHSKNIIAVKQMRRSGNSEENKRIIMDIEVVLKSHDCKYIVQCLGCFITESEVWICMELMDTCFDKLLKRLKQSVPEEVLGKVTVATVEALSYLKDKHGVIHRDVKPSNILLDMKGNVKLCDFGISGRLVDSMAKTRSAGCAAYMAPERIEPDPQNPDYDVRADVWSLGITLVELATGIFPYPDCKTDFEVLAKVIGQDPPSLPKDKNFTPEFQHFVSCCLVKDKRQRPKYNKLKNHEFIKKYETADVNVGDWYVKAIQQVVDRSPPRQAPVTPARQFFSTQQHVPVNDLQTNTNGSWISKNMNQTDTTAQDPRVSHNSRLGAYQASNPYLNQRLNSSSREAPRNYSPLQVYQNHISSLQNPEVYKPLGPLRLSSPLPQRKFSESNSSGPLPCRERAVSNDGVWRSPTRSPLPLRSQFQTDESQYNCGNTSPIILQRFYHQQKQQQMAKADESCKSDPGKKRFASYIKLQLGGDRSGRSSRHQSPEPPPRLNRGASSDSQSPLALRRAFLEAHSNNSPNLSRRYISPTPPVPPPRRLSESSSVPGSPQHLRARFLYTPEPQRRLFQDNDVS